VVLSITRWATRWLFRNWQRNLQRATATTAVFALVRRIINGSPETVFRGVLDPGSGIRIRVIKPGER